MNQSARKPHILFVMEKWHDHDPKRGLSVSHHNFLGSLESTGLATFSHFAFDEYYHTHGKRADEALIRHCTEQRPDMILLNWIPIPEHCAPLVSTLDVLAKKLWIPLVSYHTDAVWPQVMEWADTIAPYLSFGAMLDNHSFHRRSRHPDKFISLWAPEDPKIFYNAGLERDIPVSFLGTMDQPNRRPDRWEALAALNEANIHVVRSGGLRESPISLEEYGRILRTSRISLNFPLSGPHEQAKGRIFEIALSGALMMELENRETPYWFVPGQDYVSYCNPKDLVEKIRYYLQHEEERAAIAEAGHRKASEQYTARTFWSFVLDRAVRGVKIPTPSYGVKSHEERLPSSPPSVEKPAVQPTPVSLNLGAKPKILYLMLEFPKWEDASHWSLPGPLGFEDGFLDHNIEYVKIPALAYGREHTGNDFLSFAREICRGWQFDQVWFEAAHFAYRDDVLDWITSAAPVRVGVIGESLEFDPREETSNPEGFHRRIKNRQRNFPHATHFLCVDEKDAQTFSQAGKQPALWMSSCKMPRRFIASISPAPTQNPGLFFGTLYGDRSAWLAHPSLQGLLFRPAESPEASTPYPNLYRQLMEKTQDIFNANSAVTIETVNSWNAAHRSIRESVYSVWLQGLTWGCANVNLPQFGRMYASRVVEAMAVGRPVISWEIPDRPKTKALFRDGEEILLYSSSKPDQLAEHIRRIQGDPVFAHRIAENGRKKLLKFHTSEGFVLDALQWLESGKEPLFTE